MIVGISLSPNKYMYNLVSYGTSMLHFSEFHMCMCCVYQLLFLKLFVNYIYYWCMYVCVCTQVRAYYGTCVLGIKVTQTEMSLCDCYQGDCDKTSLAPCTHPPQLTTASTTSFPILPQATVSLLSSV